MATVNLRHQWLTAVHKHQFLVSQTVQYTSTTIQHFLKYTQIVILIYRTVLKSLLVYFVNTKPANA